MVKTTLEWVSIFLEVNFLPSVGSTVVPIPSESCLMLNLTFKRSTSPDDFRRSFSGSKGVLRQFMNFKLDSVSISSNMELGFLRDHSHRHGGWSFVNVPKDPYCRKTV